MIKKHIFPLVLLLSFAILMTTIVARVGVESDNKGIDMILDYDEFKEMALQSDESLEWWFERFSHLGVQYAGLHEESLESLVLNNEPLAIAMGWEILQDIQWKDKYAEAVVNYIEDHGISEYDLIVATDKEEVFRFVERGLQSRYPADKFQTWEEEGQYAVLLHGTIHEVLYHQSPALFDVEGRGFAIKQKPHSSKLLRLGLGFDEDKIKQIQNSGLKVLPRPSNYKPWMSEKYIQALLSDFEVYNMKPSVLLFPGGEILGYPDHSDIIETYMRENNIKVGLIETPVQRHHLEQDGLDELTRNLNYEAVRVFSMWPYIQERFRYYNYEGAEEIENTLYRAVTERNIRAVYFRPFKLSRLMYVTDYTEYEKMFERFEARIAQHGMSLDHSTTMAPIRVRLAKQTVMGWGIVAAAVLLLGSLIRLKDRSKYALLVLGMLFVPVGYLLKPMLMEKIVAMGAAVVFPSLAMVYYCDQCRKYMNNQEKNPGVIKDILHTVKVLVVATLISSVGALFVGGILSNIEYLLEMDIFRGVKISQLIPIIIYVGIYMAYFGYKRKEAREDEAFLRIEDIKTILMENVKVIYVILSGILLVVGYVYIARTGHETAIQPSTFELIARNILEEKLIARPRTKEFLIAFPVLMMGVYFAKKKWKILVFLAGLVAVIGQTSIINTFSHLRTPIYLSSIRTVYSLAFGIVLGIVYIAFMIPVIKATNALKVQLEKGRNE